MAGDAAMQPADSMSDLVSLMADEEAPEDEGAEGDEQEQEAQDEPEEGEDETEEGGEEAADEPEAPAKQKFTVKHDGKEIELELTPEEQIEAIQKSLDYTKKTMALAEERDAVKSERTQADQYRKQHEEALTATLDRLNAFKTYMESQVGQPPDVALAQHDVAGFLAQKQLYEDRKGQLQKANEAISAVQQEAQRSRQAQILEQAEKTERALKDTLPGFDETTLDTLADYLGKAGLNPQNAEAAFVQEGLWVIAQKAKAYDALLAKKATLKPVHQLPKVHKPSGGTPPKRGQKDRAEAFKRFDASPSLGSLAALID